MNPLRRIGVHAAAKIARGSSANHPMKAFDVSILILNWNGSAMLAQFLPSCLTSSQRYDVEVVVIDNASSDDSASVVAQTFGDTVRWLAHPDNLLFCRGYNRAIEGLNSRYVVLLNNDVAVTPHWLDPLVARMDAEPDLAALQPKMKAHADPISFEYAGACGGYVDPYGYPYARGRVFDTVEQDVGQYDSPVDVDWASGAAMLVRTEIWKELGGLDERFGMHMEEIDWCLRARRAGYRIGVVPESVVYHVGGASLASGNPRKVYYNHRNSLWMLYMHTGTLDWPKVSRIRFLLDMIAMLRALCLGRAQEARSIYRARRDAMRALGRHDGHTQTLPSTSGYRGSIVWAYYGKRLKTVKQLLVTM